MNGKKKERKREKKPADVQKQSKAVDNMITELSLKTQPPCTKEILLRLLISR